MEENKNMEMTKEQQAYFVYTIKMHLRRSYLQYKKLGLGVVVATSIATMLIGLDIITVLSCILVYISIYGLMLGTKKLDNYKKFKSILKTLKLKK